MPAYYSTDQNIAWLTNWSLTGNGTWTDSKILADDFSINGYTGWRLPNLSEIQGLYYNTLGDRATGCNDSDGDQYGNGCDHSGLTNSGPFSNFSTWYWTSSDFSSDRAYGFSVYYGAYQWPLRAII